MAPEKKVTEMVIKVDLDCEKCRKKIKRILCDIPQIQSQLYDEKANTVTITVVCCRPEEIKCKICSKGRKTVKGIEIKVPEKTKPSEKPKPTKPSDQTNPDKQKEPSDKPKPKDPVPLAVRPVCCKECYEGRGGGPCYGRPVYYNCGCYRYGYYVCRCDYYLCEENPQGCIIL